MAENDAGEGHDRPTTRMLPGNNRLMAENVELLRVNEVLRAAGASFASEIDRPDPAVVMSLVSRWISRAETPTEPSVAWRRARG